MELNLRGGGAAYHTAVDGAVAGPHLLPPVVLRRTLAPGLQHPRPLLDPVAVVTVGQARLRGPRVYICVTPAQKSMM